VFAFFTDPEKYRLWQVIAASLEPVPGGRYHVDFTRRGGARGRYLVVEPPRRIVFSGGWAFVSDPGHGMIAPPGIEEVLPGSTTVEITLVPDGDGTIVRLRHSGLPSEAARTIHGTQWPIELDRLATAATGNDAGADPVYVMFDDQRG
jgi:uncharacterized protein YndB with AHSA1/START domain